MKRSVLTGLLGSVAAMVWTVPVVAQDSSPSPAPADADQDADALPPGEIIVTARKREERLQDVPVAVTVLDDRALRDLGVTDIVDVAQLTPGLAMQDNSRQNEQPFMRGMSVNSFFPDAQNASFFHDGIFVTGTSRTLGQEDIERIEVVKGPQAVYFGRQTFAGAINYVTKKPTFDFHAHGTVSAAENNDYRMAFGVSGPIVSDVLAVRLYGQIATDDGAFQNTLDRFRTQPEQTVGGSASVTLRASDSIEFTGRAQYVEFDDGHNSAVLLGANLNNCRPNAAGLNQAYCGQIPYPESIALNLAGLQYPGGRRAVTQERYSLLGSVGFGAWELSTITAYNKEHRVNSSDGDATPVNVFRFTFQSDYDDFTQQLILNSPQGNPLRFVLGGIYYRSDRTESSLTFPTVTLSTPQKVTNFGVFGGVEYDLTDALTLGLEARYSRDKIERVGTIFSNTFEAFLPRITLDYKLTDDTLLYAVAAKGNQPGGFNTNVGLADAERIVDEQSLWNYELGLRHAFAGGRGLFAANAYRIDWDNQVVQITVPCTTPACPTPSVVANANAGKTRIWGLELEGSFELIKNLTARATFAYINAEYLDFISRLPLTYGGNQQVGGNKLQNTPERTASAALIYSRKLNSGSGLSPFGSVVYSYRSKQFLDEINTASIGSTHLLRAQIGMEAGGFRISAFGENLLNSDTPAFGTRFNDFSRQSRPSYLLALREPRSFGVRLEFNY